MRCRGKTVQLCLVAAVLAVCAPAPRLFCGPAVHEGFSRGVLAGRTLRGDDRLAASLTTREAKGGIQVKSQKLNDSVRNIGFIATIAGVICASWFFTGKWWKLPLCFALPSMIYRIWLTRGDTGKLAEVSASVDPKYIASSEEAQKELHMFMCSGCGYTLFPARGREAAFFTSNFKCPMCGAPKEDFFDMNDDDDMTDPNRVDPAAEKPEGTSAAPKGKK